MKQKQVRHDVSGEQFAPLNLGGQDWKVPDRRTWMRFLDQRDIVQNKRAIDKPQMRSAHASLVTCQPCIQISLNRPPYHRIEEQVRRQEDCYATSKRHQQPKGQSCSP